VRCKEGEAGGLEAEVGGQQRRAFRGKRTEERGKLAHAAHLRGREGRKVEDLKGGEGRRVEDLKRGEGRRGEDWRGGEGVGR
jgi:hypothetical protein